MSGIAVAAVELIRAEVRTRLPFKYGIATMVDVPHVFLRLQVRSPSGLHWGVAADHLPPKWFTKDPARPVAEEIDDMMAVIVHAATAVRAIPAPTVFACWQELWAVQAAWAGGRGFPALLAHFGTSLVERALIDAVARGSGLSLQELLHGGKLGLEPGAIHPELAGASVTALLPRAAAATVWARHTVGLGDALTDADIAAGEKLDDGLPQSLEAGIRRYGLRHFKIKIDGSAPDAALARLRAVFEVLTRVGGDALAFSLDGNEGFPSVAALREFWRRLELEPALRALLGRLLFVEQPLGRAVALEPAQADLNAWPGRPPVIIDESDAEKDDLRRALALGYAGTSHKNCKGVFKGVAHACLIAHRRRCTGETLILSGEDLCSIGPVSMLQDLAVQAVLGVESVERNGHHYFRGLTPWPEAIQRAVLTQHPDLYEMSAGGWPTLAVRAGRLSTKSVVAAPFGLGAELPFACLPGQRLTF